LFSITTSLIVATFFWISTKVIAFVTLIHLFTSLFINWEYSMKAHHPKHILPSLSRFTHFLYLGLSLINPSPNSPL
jgi:hypothetical protein